ncbi:MAG TPA: hypothetical protein VHG51_06435 [Longimicrobiaceae bacterium]|nr:hypothetical protein [Longimicrobiaceae bacterium]
MSVDTVGGVVWVTNRGAGAWGSDTLTATPATTIGSIEGDPAYLFGQVSGLAADSMGRVYVTDLHATSVRVYSPEGRHLGTIGREGEGPGEFTRPVGPAVTPDGTLFVRDETRITRFVPAPPGEASWKADRTWPGPPYAFSLEATRLGADGRFFFPVSRGRMEDQRHGYLVYGRTGELEDTLWVPEFDNLPPATAFFRTGRSGGVMVAGLSRAPFAAVPAWDVSTGGTLLSSGGREYRITETDDRGDTLRVFGREVAPRAVPEAELRDSTAELRRRIAEAPAPLERLEGVAEEVRSGRLPGAYPEVLGVDAASDGRIWVERWPAAGANARSLFDVFEPWGRYLGSVAVPARFATEPRPAITASRIYGVVTDPETGVQRIRGFEFRAPEARPSGR